MRYLPRQALAFRSTQQFFASKTQDFIITQGVHDLRSFHDGLQRLTFVHVTSNIIFTGYSIPGNI